MFERFTERSRAIVVNAQQSARDLKHAEITTGDLLLGIIDEQEGLGARALAAVGVTREAVAEAITKAEPPDGDGPNPALQVPFTDGSKRALELALREALSLGNNYIGTEHILLALMRVYEGAHTAALAAAGVDGEKIRGEVLRHLHGGGQRKAPLGTRSAQQVLLNVINVLDVNAISDALKTAQIVSKENPGTIFTEVDAAENAVRGAITKLLEARRHLSTAVGALAVAEDRERRRDVAA